MFEPNSLVIVMYPHKGHLFSGAHGKFGRFETYNKNTGTCCIKMNNFGTLEIPAQYVCRVIKRNAKLKHFEVCDLAYIHPGQYANVDDGPYVVTNVYKNLIGMKSLWTKQGITFSLNDNPKITCFDQPEIKKPEIKKPEIKKPRLTTKDVDILYKMFTVMVDIKGKKVGVLSVVVLDTEEGVKYKHGLSFVNTDDGDVFDFETGCDLAFKRAINDESVDHRYANDRYLLKQIADIKKNLFY